MHRTPAYRTSILTVTLCCLVLFSSGQNLAPNPSFETYIACPETYEFGEPLDCVPWVQGNGASADFFHQCCIGGTLCVPDNFFGSEPPHTGAAYTGMFLRTNFEDYREYIQAPLLEPLAAGMGYWVSFQVSLPENYCGVRPYGAYFSAQPPPFDGTKYIDVQPQVFTNSEFLDEMDGWTEISGCFVAQGGEAYITIGNFLRDSLTELDPGCPTNSVHSYYYLDDVVVEQMFVGTLPLELGDPVVVCYEYVIDPGLDGHYQWSDGTSNPYLLVTESGTYAVTISDLCNIGIDSIEVTILGEMEVELPPDTILCEGESITISLDPDAGDYTWQDGSDDSEYTITTTGTYQVTLDDQCDITTAEMYVEVVSPPAPFSLGDDVQLCAGEVLEFDFDPTLGEFHWQDNSSSNQYTITTPGQYALTISNMCGDESEAITVTFLDVPAIEFPLPQIELCLGDILELSFDPSLGDFIWQDGSTAPYFEITTGGDYAVTVSNICGMSTDGISVDLIEPPTVELGNDLVLCTAQLPFALTAVSNPFAWDFSWQDGSDGSVYLVTSGGLYSVTVTNSCFEATDVVEVVVIDSALVVQLPDDQEICPGDSLLLSVDNVDGNYTWQDMSTMSTYSVTNPGVYHVTVANNCGAGNDSIIITAADIVASPSLGPDINLCPGESVVLQLNDPNASFIWQDGSTNDSLVVTTAGEYHVTASNSCNTLSDTIIVTVNAIAPDVNLPTADTLCQGQSIVIDAGVSGVSYLWTDNSTGSSLTVNSAGTYGVIVSNACGSDVDSIVIADGGPAPLVELGTDVVFCPGDTLDIVPAFSNVDTWMWSNGAVTSSIEITTSGETSVIVTNSCGTSYDTINATLLPAIPAFSLGNDTAVCANENVNLSINVPDVNITWSDGSTNTELVVSNAGQYFATIANACGQYADTINIVQLPAILPLNLGNDQSLCPGELIIIDPGIPNVNYLWHDGTTGTSFSTTQATTISLTISNECGTSTDTIEVVESTLGPDVNLGPDINGCAGDEVIIQAGISGVSYTWQDGSSLPSFTTNTSGEYILNVSNNCGTDADTILIDLSGVAPVVALNADTSLCDGDILILAITSNPTDQVTWQDGTSDIGFEVNTAGTYHVTINNNCGVASDTIQIDYIAAPAPFDLGSDTVLCSGERILLVAPVTSNQIQWQDGSSAPTYTANQSQGYSLQISNACGVASDEINLTFISDQPVVDFEENILICPGDVITLDATQPFPAQYVWNTGATSSQINVTTPGTYAVTVFTNCGDISQEVIITASDACSPKTKFYIPNIFSPNGDGLNDVFEIQFNSTAIVESVYGEIYDRWGDLLFASETLPFQWDGASHGSPLNPGVFVYRFTIRYSNGVDVVTEKLTGDVTIIR